MATSDIWAKKAKARIYFSFSSIMSLVKSIESNDPGVSVPVKHQWDHSGHVPTPHLTVLHRLGLRYTLKNLYRRPYLVFPAQH